VISIGIAEIRILKRIEFDRQTVPDRGTGPVRGRDIVIAVRNVLAIAGVSDGTCAGRIILNDKSEAVCRK
jgi:hypothetical protein